MKTWCLACFTALAVMILAACGENEQQPVPVETAGTPAPAAPVKKTKADFSKAVDPEFAMLRRFDSADDTSEQKAVKPEVKVSSNHILRTPAGSGDRAEIRQRRSSEWVPRSIAPAGSLAAFFSEKRTEKIIWNPEISGGSLDMTRVTDCKISPDSSVIAFVETTGDSDGPYGSRIILLDTYSWLILKVIEIPGRWIEKITFDPGNPGVIAALCRKQKELEQPIGVAVFDLKDGLEKTFEHITGILSGEYAFAIVDGKLFVSLTEKGGVVVLSMPSLRADSRTTVYAASPTGSPVLAVSGNGKLFAIASRNSRKIRIYKTSDLMQLSTVDMPVSRYIPNQLHFVNNDSDLLVCAEDPAPVENYLLAGGSSYKLDGASAGIAVLTPDQKYAYCLMRNEPVIRIIDTATRAETGSINYKKAEPRPNNPDIGKPKFIFYLKHLDCVAVFDRNGYFYLLNRNVKSKNGERAIIIQQAER